MFDALGASVCVVVDVLSNFEVWKRSSVRHPFGYYFPGSSEKKMALTNSALQP